MADTDHNPYPGGLWAWYEGKFYALTFHDENRHMDHVTWFYELGIPDYGPAFDQVLRGRMIWDQHMDHYVLSFYGTRMIPNQVYERVIDTFNEAGHKVVERPVQENPM